MLLNADHPSIRAIKNKYPVKECFEFAHITVEDVVQNILDLEVSKKVSGNIPIKVLKIGVARSAPVLEK